MNYTPLTPTEAPLAGRIDLLFLLEDYQPEHPRERIVPEGNIYLIIELDGIERFVFDNETGQPRQSCRQAWLSGVHSNHFTIGDTRTPATYAVTQFTPGQAYALLHRDLSDFNDKVVPAAEAIGPDILTLREELLSTPDTATRIELMERFWSARYREDLATPSHVVTAIDRLREAPGELEIAQLVDASDNISHKHLVTLFKKFVGPTPKRLQRIWRFHRVFGRLQQAETVNWAELALELGYSDQAHFIRDFVTFSGLRPQEFAAEEHERDNFFPENESPLR